MIKIADILFIIGIVIIAIYFISTIINPNFIKNLNSKIKRFIIYLPLIFIVLSFIGYYAKKRELSSKSNINNINANLDSLNNKIRSDSLSFKDIDTLIYEIQKNKENLIRYEKEQKELQKRIRINNLNQRISDSILYQIQSCLKNVIIKSNYTNETKVLKSGDKILTFGGKILTMKDKVYNDIYTIDGLDIFPVIKKIDFTKKNEINSLNYYIDSIRINFKITKIEGNAKNNKIDSLLFITIEPIIEDYKDYKQFTNLLNEKIYCLDSIYFHENIIYSLTLDFPNTYRSDTLIYFKFYLKRGLIGSSYISFNK